MKPKFLFLFLPLLFCACSPRPTAIAHPKKFELPDDTIVNMRHPTCDPHPYIYGSDKKGMWRSNGCSTEYINKNAIPYQDQMRMQKRKHGK